MSIIELNTNEVLRFVHPTITIPFTILTNDVITENLCDADISVNMPIYGNPYVKFSNPIGSKFTKVTIKISGLEQSFKSLNSLITPINMMPIELKLLDNVLLTCIVYNVSYVKEVTKNGTVDGQVSLLKI